MELKPFIQRIIDEIGPRPAGSGAELKAGRAIAAEFKKRGATISTQDVPVAPGIITGLMNVLTGVYLLSVACYFFVPVVSAVLTAAFLALLILSRQFGNGVIDWMFKKTTTRNVIGRFPAKTKAARVLIFSGHHDSPDMMPMLGLKTKRYVHLVEQSIVLGMALLIPAGILRAILAGPVFSRPFGLHWYDILFGISVVGMIVGLYFRSQMITGVRNLGANDNLSAIAVLVGIADYLKKNPPKNCEVRLVAFGSEEPFMYGSWGFALGNRDLIKNAVNINMETVGSGKLGIIEKEKMYMNPYSPEAIELIERAGKRAGITLPRIAITYGGTDSYSIIKGEGKSACLFGMDETELFSLWHSPLDNPGNIEEEKLQQALSICVEAIKEMEGK